MKTTDSETVPSTPIKVAVIGASGYSGINLLRILLGHPNIEITCITSRSYAGQRLGSVFPRFASIDGGISFSDPEVGSIVDSGATWVILALPHGVASEYAVPLLDAGLRVIDLSADFRLDDPAVYEEFYDHPHPAPELLDESVYGLPEIHGDALPGARLIASPGCYPTSISLPLIPVLQAGLIDPETVCTFSMSGVSGAGRTAQIPLLFAECNESVRPYSAPKHRHLSEIEQELTRAAGSPVKITFTPHLVPVTAGICSTTYASLAPGISADQIGAALEDAYGASAFVRLLGEGGHPDTKNVVGTNFIDIGYAIDGRTGRVILMSAEDNIGKGAASQAVQAFNIATGLPEVTGLLPLPCV